MVLRCSPVPHEGLYRLLLDLLDLWRLQGPSVNSSPPQASGVHKPTNFIYTVKLGVFPECVYIGWSFLPSPTVPVFGFPEEQLMSH